jgi:hypothetical protein
MVGTFLKILGIAVLSGGVLGLFIGGFTIIYGEVQRADADDALLFTDARQSREGQETIDLGIGLVGGSFLVCGLGLVLIVAGVSAGARGRAGAQQQQQVVIVTSPPRTD